MLFDISGTHCMVDLETLDTVPGGVILSIGACMFNADRIIPGSDFYTVLNIETSKSAGLTVDPSTLEWWTNQSDEAKKVLLAADSYSSDPLLFGLGKFSNYLKHFEPIGVWGNGSDFDNAFLQVAHRAAELKAPWDFRASRCFRTLRKLCGVGVIKPEAQGTHHNALDDARWQAQYAVSIFQKLNRLNAADIDGVK
jgi:hypothetical protein